jgi:hypothetical protein
MAGSAVAPATGPIAAAGGPAVVSSVTAGSAAADFLAPPVGHHAGSEGSVRWPTNCCGNDAGMSRS